METLPQYLADLSPAEGEKTNWVKNEATLRRLLKEHPENEPLILLYLMQNLYMQEKDGECIGLCQRLLQIKEMKDRTGEYLFTIARCYEHKKDTDKAIEFYNKAIRHEPDNDENITSLADIYLERKDWDNALRTYDLLHDIDDEYAKAEELNGKGWVHYLKKELDTAMDYYRQGVAQFPKEPCFCRGIASVYGEKKDWKRFRK